MRTKDALQNIIESSSTEFYNQLPRGYQAGNTKYVVVTGSVISGVGKGTINSSLCKLLADRGLNVEPIKLEAYLNVDAGTLSPYRHGEVFVLDDGTETDLDLGSYERMIDKDLSKDNFVTSGRIYQTLIQKERAGEYLGRDVQFIPHVTGEIKNVVRNLAMKSQADVIVIEIGGTVGDYENMFALEALRELAYEEGHENVCFVNVTYILEPGSLGEHKSKAAQLGIKRLIELGIQPDVIVCRSESKIDTKIKEKISLNVNVPLSHVFGVDDIKSIYALPIKLREMDFDKMILDVLDMKISNNGNSKLNAWTEKNKVPDNADAVKIGIAGKYTGSSDTYMSVIKAIEHATAAQGKTFDISWIETTEIEDGTVSVENALNGLQGIIIPGGFGKRGVEGKIAIAQYCREKKIPYLGLCLGFQIGLIEFARNVCGLKKAASTEFNPNTPEPVVDILPEQKKLEGLGGNMRLGGKEVAIKKGTRAEKLYGSTKIRERFRHRFECNPAYISQCEEKGMVFSGKHPTHPIMQILELTDHPFFMASQYHAEFTSRPLKPSPLFLGFVHACIKSNK
jgi:CTP synthase